MRLPTLVRCFVRIVRCMLITWGWIAYGEFHLSHQAGIALYMFAGSGVGASGKMRRVVSLRALLNHHRRPG